MILSAADIPFLIVNPMITSKTIHRQTGMSYGLSLAGYDIRLAEDLWLGPQAFKLGSTVELFTMPNDILGRVCDKSTLARMGVQVFNTVIEPGWRGYLTLEIKNQRWMPRRLYAGQPIAQVLFERLSSPTPGYEGKYQHQQSGPQKARRDDCV